MEDRGLKAVTPMKSHVPLPRSPTIVDSEFVE